MTASPPARRRSCAVGVRSPHCRSRPRRRRAATGSRCSTTCRRRSPAATSPGAAPMSRTTSTRPRTYLRRRARRTIPDNPFLLERVLVAPARRRRDRRGCATSPSGWSSIDSRNPLARLALAARRLQGRRLRPSPRTSSRRPRTAPLADPDRRPPHRLGRAGAGRDRRGAQDHRRPERPELVRHLQGLSPGADRRPRRPQGRGGRGDHRGLQGRRRRRSASSRPMRGSWRAPASATRRSTALTRLRRASSRTIRWSARCSPSSRPA